MSNQTITLIPGDGIGPEIADSVQKIFAAAKVPVTWEQEDAGVDSYEKIGSLLPEATIDSIRKHKVALKGPTTTPVGGGHRSINVTLRQQLQLYANVRPVKSLPCSTTFYGPVDLIIVRENTEDLYKGIEYMIGEDVAHGIKLITRSACERIGRYACELAMQQGRKKVTVVHKANIMKLTDGLFLKTIQSLAKEYPKLTIDDLIVDNACMQLVTNPGQFDVVVTENLYGDILSDLSSGLIGGLGVACGANIGTELAVFEAVHGSAPDIAGKGLANPTALLLSAVQMLKHLSLNDDAQKVSEALFKTLGGKGDCTKDLGGNNGTAEFTKAVISNLR